MKSLAYRLAEPLDTALIADSWADSYRTSYAAGPIPMPLYQRMMRECVAWILQRPGIEVYVAYHPGEAKGSDIYGWLCVERGCMAPRRSRDSGKWVSRMLPVGGGPVVHYLYVKEIYRRDGIAKYLMRSAGVDLESDFSYTHKTAVIADIQRRIAPHARWNPMLARYPKTQTAEALSEGQAGPV